MARLDLTAAVLCLALGMAGCDQGPTPFVEVEGGGFIFNYRIAEATAGLIARPLKPLPDGSVLEARFEDPAGGPAIALRLPAVAAQRRYEFTTPPLAGIVKDRPYAVSLRLLGPDESELQRVDLTYRSNVDESLLPPSPLTVGPGYQRPEGRAAP